LFRDPYLGVPSKTERGEQARRALSEARSVMNDIINNPANKGKFYTGATSLSTDSYPLTLAMLSNKKDVVDIVPVHDGSNFDVMLGANTLGGLSNVNDEKVRYLNAIKTRIATKLGHYPFGASSSNAKRLQKQLLESALYNSHINKFNQAVGTNMPSAMYSGYGIVRPNVGLVVRKDGGPVKDDMGYWNPENWGNPVEINSNEITMQGVDQDLIGVSDAGDVKYMKANSPNNYKFKGKKVTEYPVKKNGGWLDKYN
jgi:hypothetical protein